MKIQIQFYVCVRLTSENQHKSVSFGQQHEYMRAQVKEGNIGQHCVKSLE